MVARLSEIHDLPAPWITEPALAACSGRRADLYAALPASRGQMLLDRVRLLQGLTIGGLEIPGVDGTAVRLADSVTGAPENCFISDQAFAVISADGSICLRLPDDIATDLIENGLCVRAGKNLLTWPVVSDHQYEISWRILLHAYWNATGTPPKRARRLWSEWVINH